MVYIYLVLLVAISPVLQFKGLTVMQLIDFFNLHPFWAVFTILIIFRNSIITSIKESKWWNK